MILMERLNASIRRYRSRLNLGSVWFLLGRLLVALALALVLPGVVGQFYNENTQWSFYIPAFCVGMLGIVLELFFKPDGDIKLGRGDIFWLVSLAWMFAAIIGALPLLLSQSTSSFINALFESSSGFTTTGASIFSDVESLPQSVLFWRSLTQWIGGMGIIVLGIAVLPKLAVGGMELLGAEAPGPIQEKLTPRIAQTAKALWVIYVFLTFLETGILIALGLSPFDAVTQSFSTIATGGFSTKNNSIAAFDSASVQFTVMCFMVLAGMSFAIHYQLLRGKFRVLATDRELRIYVGILIASILVVFSDLVASTPSLSFFHSLQAAAFQVVTMLTGTGFVTADYDGWPQVSKMILFFLMFTGGCAGSTSGSVKIVRLLIIFKKITVDLKRILQPHALLPVRMGKRPIPDDVVSAVTTFFVLFILLFVTGGFLLTVQGVDPITSFAASAACLANVGPGFGAVGPSLTYAALPMMSKVVLIVLMILGRLELYTVMAIFFTRRLI